jgi:hypothetical protein
MVIMVTVTRVTSDQFRRTETVSETCNSFVENNKDE